MGKLLQKSAFRRLLMIPIGIFWVLLGFLSDNVPAFNELFWIFMCSIVGGSAFALARWNSLHALEMYCIGVIVVGTIRSLSYILDGGSWGPGLVWAIVAGSTMIIWSYIYQEVKDR